jgi:hypothetical protein
MALLAMVFGTRRNPVKLCSNRLRMSTGKTIQTTTTTTKITHPREPNVSDIEMHNVMIMYNVMHNVQYDIYIPPSQITEIICQRNTCCSHKNNKSALAGRAFQNFAPQLWNTALSPNLRALALCTSPELLSVSFFKSKLKQELFIAAFGGDAA